MALFVVQMLENKIIFIKYKQRTSRVEKVAKKTRQMFSKTEPISHGWGHLISKYDSYVEFENQFLPGPVGNLNCCIYSNKRPTSNTRPP